MAGVTYTTGTRGVKSTVSLTYDSTTTLIDLNGAGEAIKGAMRRAGWIVKAVIFNAIPNFSTFGTISIGTNAGTATVQILLESRLKREQIEAGIKSILGASNNFARYGIKFHSLQFVDWYDEKPPASSGNNNPKPQNKPPGDNNPQTPSKEEPKKPDEPKKGLSKETVYVLLFGAVIFAAISRR